MKNNIWFYVLLDDGFAVPGGYIRWVWLGRKEPFIEYIKRDSAVNYGIGFILLFLLFAVCYLIKTKFIT